MLTKLKKFISDKSTVICYGAGRYAFWLFLYLKLHNVEVEYFLVSSKGTEETYWKKPILECDAYVGDWQTSIVVAVDETHHEDITRKIRGNFLNIYYLTRQDMAGIICYLAGIGLTGLQSILLEFYNEDKLQYAAKRLANYNIDSFAKLYDVFHEDVCSREYAELWRTYKDFPRYKEIEIQLRDGLVRIPDAESFLCAYQSILVERLYAFNPRFKDDVTILDFGTNVGLSLYFFATNYPNAKIAGFEADPHIYEICRHNLLALNCASYVNLHNAAVWTYDGEISFCAEGADAGHIVDNDADKETNKKVECCDALSIIWQYSHIDFLKIDIEGAETEVLQRIAQELNKVDNIFVEYHSCANKPQTLDQVVHILTQAGFRIYFGSEGLKQKNPFLKPVSYQGFDGLLNICGIRRKE